MTIKQQRRSLTLEHLSSIGVKRLIELVPYQFKVLWETVRGKLGNVEMVKGVTRTGSFNYLTNVHRGRCEKNKTVLLRFFRMMERYDKSGFNEVMKCIE